MSLRDVRRHAGRLAIVGFAGETVPDDLRRLAAAFDLGGVIYFSRNAIDPPQVRELSREVAALARDWPLWIGVDQEGGRVARLRRPFTEWPPMRAVGRAGDALAIRFAAALAAELRAVGINLDFAPVLDVATNPANRVIGDRALSDSPAEAARLGTAIAAALEADGVMACGKHFPGHGDTAADSHEELPVLDHDRRRLEAVEIVPFRAAIDAGIAAIMTAHVLVPAVDPGRPASLSAAFVDGWLKRDLGFGGLVVSDDLGMKAVSAGRTPAEAAVEAIAAGSDAVLLCDPDAGAQAGAIEAVIRAAETGALPPRRLDDAFERQRRVKARFLQAPRPVPPLDVVGCAAHAALAGELAARA